MSYEEADRSLVDALCRECATVLQRKYPHVAWGVRASVDGTMIHICPMGVGADGSYVFAEKTSVLQQTTGRDKLLMLMGGEVLERYKIDRAAAHARNNGTDAKKNQRGYLMPDLS